MGNSFDRLVRPYTIRYLDFYSTESLLNHRFIFRPFGCFFDLIDIFHFYILLHFYLLKRQQDRHDSREQQQKSTNEVICTQWMFFSDDDDWVLSGIIQHDKHIKIEKILKQIFSDFKLAFDITFAVNTFEKTIEEFIVR